MSIKYDICCIGHITLDKVITPNHVAHMPGGTAFYCSHAVRHLNSIDYSLITSLAQSEMNVVEDLRKKGVNSKVILSRHSVYFENKYGENQDDRTQRVLAKADPFTIDSVDNIDAKVYFLGALLADDFSLDFVKELSKKGQIAIDSQGYLRKVVGQAVHAIDWENKLEFMKYIHYLKVNEMEMEVLTGEKDVQKAAQKLYNWGVKEVVITIGSLGSIIYDGEIFHLIPAYKPKQVIDATGCGDTYMTGYLYKKAQGANCMEAGKFGAAMATIKIEEMGPFDSSIEEIEHRIKYSESYLPKI